MDIVRYPNRRLYCKAIKSNVTYPEVIQHIRAGHTIKIIDKKSSRDITGYVLLQFLADQAREGLFTPDAGLLRQMVLE